MKKLEDILASLLEKDDLKGVINTFQDLNRMDSSERQKIKLIKGRLTNIDSNLAAGISSIEEYTKERNKIRYGLIQLIAQVDVKEEKKQRVAERKVNIKKAVQKYGLILLILALAIIGGYKAYQYFEKESKINLPSGFSNELVSKASVKELYPKMLQDTSLGNNRFNSVLKDLYAYTFDRKGYIDFMGDNNKAYYEKNLFDSSRFDAQINRFFKVLKDEKTSFGDIYLELEYNHAIIENQENELIEKEYRLIDSLCQEIQSFVDAKYDLKESIPKRVDIDASRLKVNKRQKRVSLDIKMSNALDLPLYSVGIYIYVVSYHSQDTLTELYLTLDNEEGFGPLENRSDFHWSQDFIYFALENVDPKAVYLRCKIQEANVNGEIFEYWSPEITDLDLPYEGTFYWDKNYTSPEKLQGQCPYLRYGNKYKDGANQRVKNEVYKASALKGYTFLKHYTKLKVTK